MKFNMAAVPSGPMTSRLFSLNKVVLPCCLFFILFCFELFYKKKEFFSSEVVLNFICCSTFCELLIYKVLTKFTEENVLKIEHLCWRGHRISKRQDRYLRMRSNAMFSHQSPVKYTVGSHLKRRTIQK